MDGWTDGYKTKFSTFQAGAKLDLGLRAGQKLREMARRREEEEEVKTKASKIILLDIPHLFDFNKRHVETFAPHISLEIFEEILLKCI